jgi:hypothetical protein
MLYQLSAWFLSSFLCSAHTSIPDITINIISKQGIIIFP